jgi:hypothetical protein
MLLEEQHQFGEPNQDKDTDLLGESHGLLQTTAKTDGRVLGIYKFKTNLLTQGIWRRLHFFFLPQLYFHLQR